MCRWHSTSSSIYRMWSSLGLEFHLPATLTVAASLSSLAMIYWAFCVWSEGVVCCHYDVYRTLRPVTLQEMKGFIALILGMGIVQLSDLKDYWSSDDTSNLPLCCLLLRALPSDLQHASCGRVGEQHKACKDLAIPGQALSSVRVSLYPIHGWSSHQIQGQGVLTVSKKKAQSMGEKAFVQSDSKTGYPSAMCTYYVK